MHIDPLDRVPLWLLFVVMSATSWAALEGGYRLGRRMHAHAAGEKATPVSAMFGTTLGLLALVLACTFWMAANRIDAHRQTVLEEANAIGTTYLRTRLLPEPQRSERARLLREYVGVRERGIKEGNVAEAVARSEELHELMWVEAVKAVESKPGSITSHYIQSLNEAIDLHANRFQVELRSRIPVSTGRGLSRSPSSEWLQWVTGGPVGNATFAGHAGAGARACGCALPHRGPGPRARGAADGRPAGDGRSATIDQGCEPIARSRSRRSALSGVIEFEVNEAAVRRQVSSASADSFFNRSGCR